MAAQNTGSQANLKLAALGGLFGLGLAYNIYKKRQARFIPPKAKKVPHKLQVGSRSWDDPYHWLRDDARKRTDVIEHLEKENRYAAAQMEGTEALQKQLYDEFVAHTKEDDQELPYRHGPYYYYKKVLKGKNYAVYCRKDAEPENAPEQVLLDMNEVAAPHEFCSLGTFRPNRDHTLIAYAVDITGYESYELRVLDVKTGRLRDADRIPAMSGDMEWGVDAQGREAIYYLLQDKAHRPYRVLCHTLGTDVSSDSVVFEERDEMYWVGLSSSLSGRFLFIRTASKLTSEVFYFDFTTAATATADRNNNNSNNNAPKLITLDTVVVASHFTLFRKRQYDHLYSIDHTGDYFWIVSNEKATNFQLLRTPVAKQGAPWEVIVKHDEGRKIDDVDAFKNHVVIYGRKAGFANVTVLHLEQEEAKTPFDPYDLQFPEGISWPERSSHNMVFDLPYLRVAYQSLVTPDSMFDYDFASRKLTLRKELEVPGYDRSLYKCELLQARAHDGAQIPIAIVYRKDKYQQQNNYVLLDGYGAYGLSNDPEWNSRRLSLLDRGVVYAMPGIRGGGDMGRVWHDNGKLLTKMNTFLDFISSAEHLIGVKLTSPQRLAITGGSAGGLLMGVVLNMRPDLFKLCMTRVPFVDVMGTMSDPSIPLTVVEYEEWGNPCEDKYFQYMYDYSPYDQVKAQNYPPLLITTGLNDSRVAYWEPAKWCARLRELKTDNNPVLLKCEMVQGHGGASARYSYMKEQAFNYAFILKHLEIKA